MADTLVEFSDALAAAVEAAGPSVAQVDARRRYPASGIAWSADGVIVTASHVVRREEGISVSFGDGAADATFVGRDPATDVAVIKAAISGLTPARLGDTDALKVGHVTMALGRPGRTVRATMGIASALGSEWRTPAGGRFHRYLQADVAMHPGFSGGPLIGIDGAALGMNTSGLLRAATPTVPASDLARIVEQLLTHGSVRRGYLGVTSQPARLPAGVAERTGNETGLLVTFVDPEGPAENAGILLGDVIVAFDTTPVVYLDDLLSSLADAAGRQVNLTVVRGGSLQNVLVEVGERGGR